MRLLPDRISSQLIALIVSSVLTVHLIITFFVFWEHTRPPSIDPGGLTGRLIGFAELLNAAPGEERQVRLAQINRVYPAFDLMLSRSANADACSPAGPENRHLRTALAGGISLVQTQTCPAGQAGRVMLRLSDGTYLSALFPTMHRSLISPPVLVTGLAVLASGLIFASWGALALTRPLRALARAAGEFKLTAPLEPLEEKGPREIRTVIAAFNQMRARIAGLVKERADALAAIGHDLRTPITRLRLRSEFVTAADDRERFVADLDHMDALVRAALEYLRDEAKETSKILLDLTSLLQTIADRFADSGHDVACEAAERALVVGDPVGLSRVFENLIDNACKYAGMARMRLDLRDENILVDVIDQGPGIDESERERLLQPYNRGDAARNLDKGAGFGLGLTIARLIVLKHGGQLSLLSAVPRGLIVRVMLPLARTATLPPGAGARP